MIVHSVFYYLEKRSCSILLRTLPLPFDFVTNLKLNKLAECAKRKITKSLRREYNCKLLLSVRYYCSFIHIFTCLIWEVIMSDCEFSTFSRSISLFMDSSISSFYRWWVTWCLYDIFCRIDKINIIFIQEGKLIKSRRSISNRNLLEGFLTVKIERSYRTTRWVRSECNCVYSNILDILDSFWESIKFQIDQSRRDLRVAQ